MLKTKSSTAKGLRCVSLIYCQGHDLHICALSRGILVFTAIYHDSYTICMQNADVEHMDPAPLDGAGPAHEPAGYGREDPPAAGGLVSYADFCAPAPLPGSSAAAAEDPGSAAGLGSHDPRLNADIETTPGPRGSGFDRYSTAIPSVDVEDRAAGGGLDARTLLPSLAAECLPKDGSPANATPMYQLPAPCNIDPPAVVSYTAQIQEEIQRLEQMLQACKQPVQMTVPGQLSKTHTGTGSSGSQAIVLPGSVTKPSNHSEGSAVFTRSDSRP